MNYQNINNILENNPIIVIEGILECHREKQREYGDKECNEAYALGRMLGRAYFEPKKN